MSPAAKTIFPFGVYLVVIGALFAVVPDTILGLLGQPDARDPWIRVLGVIVSVLGVYYVGAARGDAPWFFRITVAVRLLAIPVVFGALVVLWDAPVLLMAFAGVDVLGALWTLRALRERSS